MRARYEQTTGSARTVSGYLRAEGDASYFGTVSTPVGFVQVFGFSPDRFFGAATYLEFVYEGRWYRRRWKRFLTQRGAAVAAGRFAREISGRFAQ